MRPSYNIWAILGPTGPNEHRNTIIGPPEARDEADRILKEDKPFAVGVRKCGGRIGCSWSYLASNGLGETKLDSGKPPKRKAKSHEPVLDMPGLTRELFGKAMKGRSE